MSLRFLLPLPLPLALRLPFCLRDLAERSPTSRSSESDPSESDWGSEPEDDLNKLVSQHSWSLDGIPNLARLLLSSLALVDWAAPGLALVDRVGGGSGTWLGGTWKGCITA